MIGNEDCRLCVVNLPIQMLYIVNGADIVGFCRASEFNSKYGRYALNKFANTQGWPQFTNLTFTGSTRVPALQTEDDSGFSVDISTRGLFNIIIAWACTERGAILPDDLQLIFEKDTQSLRNAETWTQEVLPSLMAGVSHETHPLGSSSRHSIQAERSGHMAATWDFISSKLKRPQSGIQ